MKQLLPHWNDLLQLLILYLTGNATGIITARKRSLRRLCFHRCLSVHRGVYIPACNGADTQPGQTPPCRHPPGQTPLPGRHPPGQTPPCAVHAWYGQQAGGTHPTGMHSCLLFSFQFCSYQHRKKIFLKRSFLRKHFQFVVQLTDLPQLWQLFHDWLVRSELYLSMTCPLYDYEVIKLLTSLFSIQKYLTLKCFEWMNEWLL